MNFKNLRVSVIVLTSFIALAFFLLGYSLWNDHQYLEPLEEYLSKNKVVSDYEIREGEEVDYYIELEFNYQPNLNVVFVEVEDEIDKILENKDWELIISNRENEILREAFYESHFSLFEARERGNYTKMYEEIDEILGKYEFLHYQVHVLDDGRILFQMENDTGFLIFKLGDGEIKEKI